MTLFGSLTETVVRRWRHRFSDV